jgi:NADPH-dependent 2,4-dienoyl-CoA reductase/sulfur reductase-like enzyme/rhodanese-related sulfurtransferase
MPQHVVVIGAVALGPKAACRFKRLEPDSRVTMIERGKRISYGGCGIPYYVSGDISDASALQSTAFHMLRDEAFFKATKGVDVRTETEALAIDPKAKTVTVRHLPTGREETLSYDKLVMATGSTPNRLPVPGADLDGVYCVAGLEDAEAIRARVASGKVGSAVVVGGGFIGLEMATAFADMWGIETTVLEYMDHILPSVAGPVTARMACRHMEEKGVHFRFGEKLMRLEGDGAVERLVTDKGTIDADLVILSVGVTPNSKLAKDAGLHVGPRGGIIVDETLRTSDPDIFAGGDCVQIKNLVTGGPSYLPLGSMANRQGRVIGTNLAGGHARFEGASGAWCVKLFEQSAAGVGLPIQAALREGFDAVNVHVSMLDRAHFYPEKGLMSLDLVVENTTGRILGMQGVSVMGDSLVGKVDAVSAMLPHKPVCADLGNLEMAYSPPFASAMDILNVLGNVADNIVSGQNRGMGVDEFEILWAERADNGIFVLDCRERDNVAELIARHPKDWHNIPQGELAGRLAEVPKDRPVVVICNTGARSYEALVTLVHNGYAGTRSVEGGMAAVHAAGLDI